MRRVRHERPGGWHGIEDGSWAAACRERRQPREGGRGVVCECGVCICVHLCASVCVARGGAHAAWRARPPPAEHVAMCVGVGLRGLPLAGLSREGCRV